MIKKLITFNIIFFLIGAPISFSQETQNSTQEEPAGETNVTVDQTQQETEVPQAEQSVVDEPIQEEVNTAPQEIIEEPVIQEENVQPQIEKVVIPKIKEVPKKPILKSRNLNKKIILDKNPQHLCTPSSFVVNITNKNEVVINLNIKEIGEFESQSIEVGSLPKGIDLKFTENDSYSKSISSNTPSVTVKISREPGAQKGSFNVPIIHTLKKSSVESTGICQINIVNNG